MTDQEINIAIAKKLGWKDLTIVRSERLRDELLGNREGSPPFGETIPDYCHKIEAAWEIVEFVRPAYAFDFHSSRTEYFANMSGPTWKRLVSGKADTAPMAICLAFLKLEG